MKRSRDRKDNATTAVPLTARSEQPVSRRDGWRGGRRRFLRAFGRTGILAGLGWIGVRELRKSVNCTESSVAAPVLCQRCSRWDRCDRPAARTARRLATRLATRLMEKS
ncbi:MAG: hypothetical protein JW810_11900 [Sedimentisphaerales bacterium]|nr:hypothetical protein [Sedimentisphaerales bacterium]